MARGTSAPHLDHAALVEYMFAEERLAADTWDG